MDLAAFFVTLRRIALTFVLIAGLAAVLVALTYAIANRRCRDLALTLLGPGSTVAEVRMHLDWVELRGVRVPPSEGWPAKESLTADVVEIHPDLSTVLSPEVRIREARGHGVYFSVLRTGDRQIRFLPTILPRPPRDPSQPPPRNVFIEHAAIDGGTLDLYDASIRQPAHHMRIVEVTGEANDMLFPKLTSKAKFQIKGQADGGEKGAVEADGWTVFSAREGEFHVKLEDVDIHRVEPYFLRNHESGSATGRLDLDMTAKIHDHHLDAPGHMRLTDFELDAGEGPVATFMGLPRKAVIASMADKKGRIDLSFEMKGDLGDAKFSLNENFAVRVAAGIGTVLGVTVGGVVKGIGNLGESTIDAVGSLFGGKKDKDKKKDRP